ncbi:acyl carrier protein [Nonomuraea sp. NPDC055795]
MRAETGGLSLDRPLTEMGMDSLLSVALRTGLEERLGVPIPVTLLWNRPTIRDIAGYLAEEQGSTT